MDLGTDNFSSSSSNSLLGDFPKSNLVRWEEEVKRLLKGADFAKTMVTETLEGIRVRSLYTAADTGDFSWLDSLPGQAPFVRGTKGGGYLDSPWLIAQELLLPSCGEFNEAIVKDLGRGQSAVNLVLDRAGRAGLDPDQAAIGEVGVGGTSVVCLADLEEALSGVDLTGVPLLTQSGSAALGFAALTLAFLGKNSISPELLKGCLGFDPACELVRRGSLSLSRQQAYSELAILTRWAIQHAPGLKTLPVFEDPYHEGGADSALGLGLTLAAAVQQLRGAQENGIEPADAAAHLQFHLSLGSDFFTEIAKVRSLRLLWHEVLTGIGCPEITAAATIHARTSRLTQTVLDPHVNLLRVTTQAMSAVLGGVDSLHVGPFDEVNDIPDDFSRRIARNVQLVLAEECHFEQVADPAGGSYYVESLTDELSQAAWTVFQEIETAGGLIAALGSGLVQEKVTGAAEKRAGKLAVRKMVQVGTNQYANTMETEREVRKPDPAELLEQGVARMARTQSAGNSGSVEENFQRLKAIREKDPDQVLPILAEAAKHGATLGAMMHTMGHEPGSGPTVQAIPLRRDAQPFEDLRRRVQDLGLKSPSAGRVLCACLGDFARYMPRLDFTRRFFAVGGFHVLADGFFQDAEAVALAAKASDARTVVIVGLDDTYSQQAVPAVEGLKALDPPPLVYLAGRPDGLTGPLEKAGVKEFIHARSHVLEVLNRLVDSLEEGEVRS
ncbi:MAG: acyl-CoA mutase large subunit family protein [Gemmatimonadales bacterium]|nr:acyl-CoA mutase large subunit family protein [Gemmatimonadales bacterium]